MSLVKLRFLMVSDFVAVVFTTKTQFILNRLYALYVHFTLHLVSSKSYTRKVFRNSLSLARGGVLP